MTEKPHLKAKDAPDLGKFDWTDPFRLSGQLTEEERMLGEAARAPAAEARIAELGWHNRAGHHLCPRCHAQEA